MTPNRVLVAADSALARRTLSTWVASIPRIDSVASASTPTLLRTKLSSESTSVVLVDTGPLFPEDHTAEIVWAVDERTAVLHLTDHRDDVVRRQDPGALRRSASIARPEQHLEDEPWFQSRVAPALLRLASRGLGGADPRTTASGSGSVPIAPNPAPTGPPQKVQLVVVGVSTGGPDALATLLPQLPSPFPVPILVVQHMPAAFIGGLAERLARVSGHDVAVAAPPEALRPGTVRIAGGGSHLAVDRSPSGLRTIRDDGPPENSCRPAVDVLFRTAATAMAGGVLGVVLTGMGGDGVVGSGAIRAAGGAVVVQDEGSSVVWGMPGLVWQAGLADAVLPLGDIGAELVARVSFARAAAFLRRR